MLKTFFVAIGTALYERVWLSYKSTIFGIAVACVGEALNYTLNAYPDPRVHAVIALLTTIFIAWKERKVAEGKIKLLVLFLFVSFGAFAQTPSARAAAAHNAIGANPDALAGAIAADPNAVPPDVTPAPVPPKFGGCSKNGKVCFGPSISATFTAINLTTHKVEGAFSPGVGYGFTLNPNSWSNFGVSVHLVVDPGAQQASCSLILKFANYLRVGVSKGFIGDKSLRVPVGFGVDL